MAHQADESSSSDLNDKDNSFEKDEKKGKKGKKSKKPKETSKEDEELSELLNSALEDFATDNLEEECDKDEKTKPSPPNMLWDEEFLRLTAEKFQQGFQSGFGAGDTPLTAEQLGQNIQSLAEAATQMFSSEASPDAEFSNFFAQTLKQFSEAPAQLSEEELKNMMANIEGGADNPEFAGVLPLILSMVQNLLSKEVLYSDLKSVIEKYPKWLEDNKEKLAPEEEERHTKKLRILRNVCTELEGETPNELDSVKKARCDRLLLMLMEVQDLGPTPPEIAGDLSPMLGMHSQGFPQFPPNMSPNQCCIF